MISIMFGSIALHIKDTTDHIDDHIEWFNQNSTKIGNGWRGKRRGKGRGEKGRNERKDWERKRRGNLEKEGGGRKKLRKRH